MAFRIVMIESDVQISLKLNNLIVNKGEGDIWIPLNDISVIVLDNLNTVITARLLSTIADNNICMIICNQKHLPIGYYSSYDNHSRISKNIGYQIEKSMDFYDELWVTLIKQKINNQIGVIHRVTNNETVIGSMNEFMNNVLPGDPSNREAHAAKVYFNDLMGSTFSRGNEDILLNSGLDYCYAIVRAYIARVCVSYGLNTQIGIHHKNEYNRFNLVDDLIEPIRPIADIYVYRLLEGSEYFESSHRRALVNFLNHKIEYNNKNMYMCNMIEEYVEQYAAYIAGKREVIIYPNIEGYNEEQDEI